MASIIVEGNYVYGWSSCSVCLLHAITFAMLAYAKQKRDGYFQSSVYYDRNLAWHGMGKQPIMGAWSLLCHGQ